MSRNVCPYCGHPPDTRGGATKDHVFVEALGGRMRVIACKQCNSKIGHDIEGALQRPHELLGFLRQALGTGLPPAGTIGPDDTPVTYDITTGELRARQPVETSTDGDIKTYRMHGGPDQVRQILRGMGMSAEEIETRIRQAERPNLGNGMITTTVTHDLNLAHRLAAKCALGAGERAFGESFLSSPMAQALRDILWEQSVPERAIDLDALENLEHVLAQVAGTWPRLQPGERESQVVFIPVVDDCTAIVVHVAGVPLGMAGQIVTAPLPEAGGLPVLVRDRAESPEIVKYADALAATVAAIQVEPGT